MNSIIQDYLQGCIYWSYFCRWKERVPSPLFATAVPRFRHWGSLQERYFQSGEGRKTRRFSFWSWRLMLAQVNFVFVTSLAVFSSRFWLCFACLCAPCNCCRGEKKPRDQKMISERGAKTNLRSPGSRSLTSGWSSDPALETLAPQAPAF